jgi:soluble lytic murein transglycosylase-like protein
MRRVLMVAGAGALMLFSLAFVLADQASANDGPLCAPASGFIPKLCVNLPLAASRQGIDPVRFLRQIAAESDFNPNAVSKAGAVGIAQIMPALHPAVDPTDPYASLDYAARLMRRYIIHFGDWRRALVAYNAGPGRLMPGNPHYLPLATLLSDSFGGGETKRYVARILGR